MTISVPLIFMLSFFLLGDAGPSNKDEKDCYETMDWPKEFQDVQDGATALDDYYTGKEDGDGAFRKVVIGYIGWQKIGLSLMKDIPGMDIIAGPLLTLLDKFSPTGVSSEMKCMRVILEKLNKIENKLKEVHGDVKRLIQLFENLSAMNSYSRFKSQLRSDEEALNSYKLNSKLKEQATHACSTEMPMGARRGLGKVIQFPSEEGDFLKYLRLQANCNDTAYVFLSSMIMTTLIKATALEDACYIYLNKEGLSKYNFTDEDTEINKVDAAGTIRNVSIALLASRLEMQRECLEKEIEKETDEQTEKRKDKKIYNCPNNQDLRLWEAEKTRLKEEAEKTAETYGSKYSLLKMSEAKMCNVLGVLNLNEVLYSNAVPVTEYTERYAHKSFICDQPLPSFCKVYQYPKTRISSEHNYMFPVPEDTTEAAIQLINMDNDLKMSNPNCTAVPQVCWPCNNLWKKGC